MNNTINTVLLTSLVSACCPQTQNNVGTIFHTDFNNDSLHTYTNTDVNTAWDAYTAITLAGGITTGVTDPDPSGSHGKTLRAFYSEGNYGYSDGSGGQWIKKLDDYDELYFAFDVYFPPGFDFVKTGKLHGPRSTDWNVNVRGKIGHQKPDGTDFWTAITAWRLGGELIGYSYHPDQSNLYGEPISWNDGADGQKTYLPTGEWVTIETRVKINAVDVADGIFQGWYNGELRLDRRDFMWRKNGGEDLKIGQYMFLTFFGGGDATFAASKDEHVYFDNFVISTQPITH